MLIIKVARIIPHPARGGLRFPDRTGHILSFQFHCMYRLVGHSFSLAEQSCLLTLPFPSFLGLGLDHPLLFIIGLRFPLTLGSSFLDHALESPDIGVVVCTQLFAGARNTIEVAGPRPVVAPPSDHFWHIAIQADGHVVPILLAWSHMSTSIRRLALRTLVPHGQAPPWMNLYRHSISLSLVTTSCTMHSHISYHMLQT